MASRRLSPSIRLDQDLVTAAKTEGALNTRSAPEQIQFWARIGKAIQGSLTSNDLLSLIAGTVNVKLVPKEAPYIDPMSILDEPNAGAANHRTQVLAMKPGYAYQASSLHPGKLEKVYPDGRIEFGLFENGQFVAEGQL